MKRTHRTQRKLGLNDREQTQLASAWELDSTSFAWDNRWGMPLEAAAVGAFAGDDVMRPPTSAIFQQARRWYRLHAFIRHTLALKQGFCNFGLLGQRWIPDKGERVRLEWHPGLRAEDPREQRRVERWKEAEAAEIARVATEVWHSFLLCRNVVALWRKRGRVILRPPESCAYEDTFGLETLTIRHGLDDQQIRKLPGLTDEERRRLSASKEVKLTHDDRVFQFAVLKEEPLGMGFGWPDLVTVFHACSLNESLLVGDRQLAEACRTVYEQHLLGHEIKSGNHAGSPAHFMKAPRAKAVRGEIKAKKGHIQMATNFDHKIVVGAGRPEPAQYDTKRYAQVAEQLATWGLPWAQMWLGGGGQINPFLMSLARIVAHQERVRVRPYLTRLLTETLHPPVAIALQWDDQCFWDSRLMLEVLKNGLASGPISQESYLRCTGFEPADERAAKARDASLPKEVTLPVFDPAHGKRPQEPGGKPSGKADHS